MSPKEFEYVLASQLLKQRYRILSQAGGGGFALVYKAEDTLLGNRLVAIKKMDQSNPSSQDIADFKREALTLASLPQHPNLPNIYEYFEEAGSWYIVMSFIEGETLEDYLYQTIGKPLPPEEIISIGIQLSNVMEFLHDQHPPIIFRDLKPSNIMRTSKGHLYLIDFGIARHFDPLRNNTAALGTLGYAAPEQTGKTPRATPQSDIYTLGATLHELLSGNDPSNTPFIFAPLKLPRQFNALEALVLKMVNMNVSQRPASMQEIKKQLEDILSQLTASTPIMPQPVSPPSTPPVSVQPGICSFCGMQNPVGTAFCADCGGSLLSTSGGGGQAVQPTSNPPVQNSPNNLPRVNPNYPPKKGHRLPHISRRIFLAGVAGVGLAVAGYETLTHIYELLHITYPNLRVLYQENGSDNWKGWKVNNNSKWQISENMLHIDTSTWNGTRYTDEGSYSLTAPINLSGTTDYAVEVSVLDGELIGICYFGTVGGSFGISVRGSGEDIGSNNWQGYMLIVDASLVSPSNLPNPSVFITKSNYYSHHTSIENAEFNICKKLDTSIYRVEVKGNLIRLFVNGEFIIEARNNDFPNGGQVGIVSKVANISVSSFTVFAI